jgi:glutamate-1-semialdehyde 2,1-aminomutase
MALYEFNKSIELFKRATKVIPSGIYGHMSPAITVPGSFPYYAARGEGSHYWDVDGNEFIDYMCAYGPMVLGYNHPKVEAAVNEQRKLGNCFNHPGEIMVKLAEKMCKTVSMADWVVFAKNGADVTNWALMVAREFTGRPKVLAARGGYHGTQAWCTPGHGGIIDEDREHIHLFNFNDIDSFSKLAEEYRGKIAAAIITPYHHPAFADSALPAAGWWKEIRKICDDEGIVLILDDVRAGFRLDIRGSHEYFGFKPDLACYCKAIGNCYPISACAGTEKFKNAASRCFLTGSFWNSVEPMVAAYTVIEVMEETNAIPKILEFGKRLMDGLNSLAKSHGLQIATSGPTSIPFVRFSNENNFFRQQRFCAEATRRGIFFHPHHNWFISAAHTDEDLKQTLKVADECFAIVKKEFGS